MSVNCQYMKSLPEIGFGKEYHYYNTGNLFSRKVLRDFKQPLEVRLLLAIQPSGPYYVADLF